jgi:hypothetical protein
MVIGAWALPNVPAAGYKLAGVGDFNGDGSPDLVFQNATTGQIAVWYMNGSTVAGGGAVGPIPFSNYQVVGPR